jgi:uncharacterized delta-60 repeat protein
MENRRFPNHFVAHKGDTCWESIMRFRSVVFFLCAVLFLWIPTASAQKRVFKTMDPNATAINDDADIYDPGTGILTPAAHKMNVARQQQVAIRLLGGKVLLAGGYNGHYLNTAEIFDPVDKSFTFTGNLNVARSGAAAVLLRDGTVLVVGGYNGYYLNHAELYNPFSETFSPTSGFMLYARQDPAIVLLSDGNVLVTGGYNGTSGSEAFYSTTELYDPATRTFSSSASMSVGRQGHTATLLSDGNVLVAGGCNNTQSDKVVCDNFLDSAEVYNSDEDSFSSTGAMNAHRMNHTATLLPNGKVLIAGGTDGTTTLASAELYDPGTGVFTRTGDMGTARMGHTASILPDGKVLIAGGYSDHHLASAEIYDPETGTFTTISSSLAVPRLEHSATVLSDGKVLIAGGQNNSLLTFDINFQSVYENVSPNIVFTSDSKVGFVPYTGSGVIVAFSTETGEVIKQIVTGGKPAFITPLLDGQSLAVVSAFDNEIFIIDMGSLSLRATYTFTGTFGFGSILSLSPDGNYGYVSSTSTGEVIKFDVSTGNELGRLGGLEAPAQITVTKDGNTLLIVDTVADELVFADSSSMTIKNKIAPLANYPGVSFTIFSKAVLNLDETEGVIASNDATSTSSGLLFVFDMATGEIVTAPSIGLNPGFTALLPTDNYWLVLCQYATSTIPMWDPDSVTTTSIVEGSPLGSANIIFSNDSRYAYYASSSADRIFQLDIGSQSVVGSFPVGDDPNISLDQPAYLAAVPGSGTMIVLDFASNRLDFLTDTTVLRQTKLISQQNKFTGLSLVNLSDRPANLTITVLTSGGGQLFGTDVTNPVTVQLEPNAQMVADAAQLFNLDNETSNTGRLFIESSEPGIAGYSTVGQIQPNFLNPFLSNLQAVPFYPDYRESLHDWIIPEIPQASGATTELNFVNPNYNPAGYEITHYGTDGTILMQSTVNSINGSLTDTKQISDIITTSQSDQVLIYGGHDSTDTRNTAETFDLASKTFVTVPSISKTPRYGHTATLLPNGKVLMTGGKNGFTILRSAELFDPVERIFSSTGGTMISERYRHTATLLPNGKVLLAGGQNSVSINNTAELYDPLSGSFSSTAGSMVAPRDAHTATLLPDGRVLLAGGLDGVAVSATAEIYDPATSRFYPTGSMNTARAFHTAVLLPNGKVFIAGGYNGSYLNSAELYDPSTGLFTLISSMNTERSNHTSTLLSDGTVLIAGGTNASGPLDSAELYDPDSGLILRIENSMTTSRTSHTATLLSDDPNGTNDSVLITGGFGIIDDTEGTLGTLGTAELYTPETRQFAKTSLDMSMSREEQSATLLTSTNQGYLRTTSTEGMLFTELYSNGGKSTSINGINMDRYTGVTRIYSPLFVISSDFETLLDVINGNQDNEASVTITLHAPDGSVLIDPVTRILPKNAQWKGNLWDIFKNDPSLQNQSGWLEISSTVDRIVGTVSFTNSEESFLASFELSGIPMSQFVFPLVSEDSAFETGLAMLNGGDQPADVQIELWGVSGTLDAYRSITLAPGARISEVLSQLFPGVQSHHSGNVRVHSNQPLHALGTMFDRGLGFVAAIPPVSIPEP